MKVSEKFKLMGISIMAIVGLVACSKQGATETAANKTPGNLQQSATLKGTYKSEEGFKNGFDLITYYPDGAYIESSHSINQDNGKTTTSFVRVGMCQQNGEQLDCRQTGSVNYEFNERDFQPTDVTTTELIKMDTNGNYRTILCGHGAQRCCDSKNYRLGKVKTLAETNADFDRRNCAD